MCNSNIPKIIYRSRERFTVIMLNVRTAATRPLVRSVPQGPLIGWRHYVTFGLSFVVHVEVHKDVVPPS